MSKLIIVSNRLPVSMERRKGGLSFQQGAGGLATGIASFYKTYESIWVGWPGIDSDKIEKNKEEIRKRLISEFNCHPVFLPKRDFDNYYSGFCNNTIWPLFHYFPQHTVYKENFWKSYKRINELFCEEVLTIAKEEDVIWIHDYQLMLLPKLLREKLPDATIGFFLHIPFPSFELFRILPWRNELLEGLIGSDLIGFHTYDYALNFLKSSQRLLGYEQDMGQIHSHDRVIKVDTFPLGIEFKRYYESREDPKVEKEIEKLKKDVGKYQVILSIDRLDYTKGIIERLEGFNTFLEKNPEYKEKVVCILVAVPSRSQVTQYKMLKSQVDELIGKINGKHGTIGWIPIHYLYKFLPYAPLTALYNIADISLVTPLRDGMNLIAKEYIATKTDGNGVLILSEMTGAAKELGEALIVNPNNNEEMADAIKKALEMPGLERIEKTRIMQKRIERYNVVKWAEDFVGKLKSTKILQRETHTRVLKIEEAEKLKINYKRSSRCLFFLDYDGTLTQFFERPENAKPNNEVLGLLESLSSNKKNEVVLISGREKETLNKWFGHLNLNIISEHGVWMRKKQESWVMLEPLKNDWKDEIKEILELHVDRTPGSFIEEKEFSLVFHYRRVDPEIGSVRVSELKDNLLGLTSNKNLQVLEGHKVIDIKNSEINKGHAVLKWLSKNNWDFILSVGDDVTDEDMFSVMPESAYSIKVGLHPTCAKYNIKSPLEVIYLLKKLVD
tara:strand:- start:18460 stop:20640 length:2181 start_codon:yes stop_codon:yes gene_type:complete